LKTKPNNRFLLIIKSVINFAKRRKISTALNARFKIGLFFSLVILGSVFWQSGYYTLTVFIPIAPGLPG